MDSVAFWGTVSDALNDRSAAADLPPEDDRDVVWLAYAMLIFFIVSLVLLVLYGITSAMLIYAAYKGNR